MNADAHSWTVAALLRRQAQYNLRVYCGWAIAYGRGLCTESELARYLRLYELADDCGITWRGWYHAMTDKVTQ